MKSINELFDYFDEIVATGSDDQLFASSYLRDFINLASTELNEEEQLTKALYELVSENVKSAKSELSPQDQLIVNQFWTELSGNFS